MILELKNERVNEMSEEKSVLKDKLVSDLVEVYGFAENIKQFETATVLIALISSIYYCNTSKLMDVALNFVTEEILPRIVFEQNFDETIKNILSRNI